MEHLPDNHYIDKVLTGDTEAFSELVGRYSERVFALCVRIVQNREDAQDVTQEAFIKIFDNLSRLRFRFESSFSTWVYRIAFNTAMSYIRKNRNAPGRITAEISDDHDTYDDSGREWQLAQLEKTVESLSPEDRALIQLFYREERQITEIAEITSMSVANVKTRLHRIRKKIGETCKL